ncbi:hypothetical protein PS2_019905 [Malus domestica]
MTGRHNDGRNPTKKEAPPIDAEVETRNLGGSSASFRGPVFESKEEDEEDENQCCGSEDYGIEICEETIVANVTEDKVPEIVEEEDEEFQPPQLVPEQFEEEDLKPMKDHIDLDPQTKKRDLKEIAGSFGFQKKLQKLR